MDEGFRREEGKRPGLGKVLGLERARGKKVKGSE